MGITGPIGPQGIQGLQGITGPSGSSITNNNYTWAFKNNTQKATTSFSNILFTNTPEISGWVYDNILGHFQCNQSGKYIINYTASVSAIGGSRSASIRGAINNIEVIGSACSENLQSTSINQTLTNFFILNISNSQLFSLQFVGNSTNNESLDLITAIAGETPISCSMIITRIS